MVYIWISEQQPKTNFTELENVTNIGGGLKIQMKRKAETTAGEYNL